MWLNHNFVQSLHAISISNFKYIPFEKDKGVGFGSFYCGYTHILFDFVRDNGMRMGKQILKSNVYYIWYNYQKNPCCTKQGNLEVVYFLYK